MTRPAFLTQPPAAGSEPPDDIAALAPWFHNLHLPDGRQTAPGHPLGDFPRTKWDQISGCLPERLDGWRVLDIGCNAGFYSIALAQRGAHVVALDREPHFLAQARWALREFGLEHQVELREAQIYDLAAWDEVFDLVLFLGVFYHLRYPVLGLDLVAEKVRRLLVFQTLSSPGEAVVPAPEDLDIEQRAVMAEPGWPKMAFIERALAGDETNWWAPNHACILALLRSTGLRVIDQPGHEIYICEPRAVPISRARHWDRAELHAATHPRGVELMKERSDPQDH